ncbi:OmpA family protein [Flavobacterium sp. H4147]|uniref:OmpA family protein n=1 Tax=Flavobacterium sp. H4147 TaxID=3034149 RepID=UPI0023EBD404|nr:OmpA family protein [Flavobacterium sp. H4147]
MIYKNIKTILFLLLAVVSITGTLNAQDKKLEKADAAYNKFAFVKAGKLYEKLIKNGNNSVGVYTKLGDCYYFNARYHDAAEAYSKVLETQTDVASEYYFRYAQALNNSQNYDEAAKILKVYYAKKGDKDLSDNWKQAKLMADIKKQSDRYLLKEVEINTPASDFGTGFYGQDKVVYASARDTGVIIKRKHSWNEKSFLKLYTADISVDGGLQNPTLIKGDVNTKYHQSSPAITKDGKTMFFTRNNYKNGKLDANKEGISYLKIYTAQNINGEWKNVKALGYPINSDDFSSGHPALSADETQLFFVSDRNNKFGNSDLYVVSLKKGGFVSNDVRKLGDEINTPGRETFPFVDNKGILYFSSDGHPGLGGLDVFAAMKDTEGVYHVVNVGDEINSADDDFAYQINESKMGYFSSNRDGNDNIYAFTETRPVDFGFINKPIIFGKAINLSENVPIAEVEVDIYNDKNEKITSYLTDKQGKYQYTAEPYKNYTIIFKKQGLIQKTKEVAAMQPMEKTEVNADLYNDRQVKLDDNSIVTIKPGDDLTKIINLKPIYFDYNGYKIRESSKAELNKIVALMNDRPKIVLTINSHTDSRGRDEFNMKLSENRANATVDYLIEKGISPDRLSGHGYGETRLINKCSNGVPCTEAEHQLNRRSEFIVGFRE